MGLGYPHPTGMEVPMGTEEPLTVVTARVTATESQWAKDLGSGNASAGIRRAIRAAHQLHETGTKAQPDARLSQLLEHALKQAHNLEAAAAADVTSTPERDWLDAQAHAGSNPAVSPTDARRPAGDALGTDGLGARPRR